MTRGAAGRSLEEGCRVAQRVRQRLFEPDQTALFRSSICPGARRNPAACCCTDQENGKRRFEQLGGELPSAPARAPAPLRACRVGQVRPCHWHPASPRSHQSPRSRPDPGTNPPGLVPTLVLILSVSSAPASERRSIQKGCRLAQRVRERLFEPAE